MSGDPDASSWAQIELEAEEQAAAIIAETSPPLPARPDGSAAGRPGLTNRARAPRALAFVAVAGLAVVLGLVIAVASAARGSPVSSPQPPASLVAIASTPPAAAATVAPSASSIPLPRPTAPAPTPRPTPSSPAARINYTVQPGDTLIRIAALYRVTVAQIVQANRIPDPHLIYSGQTLEIPPPTQASP